MSAPPPSRVKFERILEGILKRYPEIGDRPKRVLSNPPEGSIETLKVSIEPQKVLSNPVLCPPKIYRALVRGTSEPQKRFCQTFRIAPPPFQVNLLKLSLKFTVFRTFFGVKFHETFCFGHPNLGKHKRKITPKFHT